MRQFDLYRNPASSMAAAVPYVVVLSSHLLPDIAEVIVAPLLRRPDPGVTGVEVRVEVDGEVLILSLTGLTAIWAQQLKIRSRSLLAYEDDIRRALDRLFTGF